MWLDTSLFLLAIVAIMNAIFVSGTTSYGLTTFFQCHSLEALCIPLITTSTVNNKPKEERPNGGSA